MMTYDGLVLAAVVAELRRTIEMGRIQQIRQHNDSDLTFEIRGHSRTYLFFTSVSAKFARVHLAATNPPVPQTAPNFCMLLRKHIKGAFITKVEQAGFDRVLRIHIEAPDGNRNTLVLELMGKHSNLILLSDTGRILGAVKHVGASVSRYRQVLPGRDYIPPPGGDKTDPLSITKEEFEALWREGIGIQDASQEDARHWLVAAFSGMGPFLAEEILMRAGSPTPDAIWSILEMLRQIVSEQDYAPVLITNERGSTVYAYPIPVGQYPPADQHERHSFNEVLDTLYRDLVHHNAYDSEYATVQTAVKRSLAARKQTLRQLETAVAEGSKAERYKQIGELIVASQHTIPKGAETVRLIDYYDPAMPEIEVRLDDKQSPYENAERLFNRARKARDGARMAQGRLTDIREEEAALQSALEQLPNAAEVEDLRAIRKRLADQGLLRPEPRPVTPGKREEPEFGTARIRRVTSSDGLEILYGENSQSNDYLTTKVAKPNDLWFHARSVTGAHVVIRTANRPDSVPPSTIREAAIIAAKNCNAKHSSLVPVDYTLRKHVRKPRSAPQGLVTYQKERTIDVVPTKG